MHLIHKTTHCLLCCLYSFFATAQGPGTGSVTLMVLIRDSTDNSEVSAATVVVYDSAGNVLAKGASSGKGKYSASVPAGRFYQIAISSLGYKPGLLRLADSTLYAEVVLAREPTYLQEVRVVKRKDLIQDLGDKIVYNADRDIDLGGSAVDVLRKVPMVSVDVNGRPSIKSNSDVKILINGRPSAVQDPSLLLKMLPSGQISKIEVIMSPSARYEAEGSAGIINIVTKGKLLLGTKGTINGGIGTKGSHLLGSLYYSKDKLVFNASYGSYWFYDKTEEYTSLGEDSAEVQKNLFQQKSSGSYNGSRNYVQASANYSFTESDVVGVEMIHSGQDARPNSSSSASYSDLHQDIERNTNSDESSVINSISIFYDHNFKKPQEKLSARFNYGVNNNNIGYNYSQFTNGSIDPAQLFSNGTGNKEVDGEINYQQKIFHNKNLAEVGIRQISRSMNSQFNTWLVTGAGQSTSGQSNGFLNYQQSISAAYLTNTYKASNIFSFRGGVRYEGVSNNMKLPGNQITQRYSNFFPSGGATWRLSASQNLSLNYTYRIRRPSIQFLNPATNSSEVLVQYSGNPYIHPEYTHKIELSFGTYIKDSYFKLSPYYSSTRNFIGSLSYPTANGLQTSYGNVGREKSAGFNLWGTLTILKNMTISNSFDLIYVGISNDSLHLSNQGFSIAETFNISYALNSRYSFQYFGNFFSQGIQLQGKQSSYSFSSLAFKSDFAQKKYSIAISVDNPFRNNFNYQITNRIAPNLDYMDATRYYDRGFRAIFTYNFGKSTEAKAIDRKKADDDLKEKADKGQGQGSQF